MKLLVFSDIHGNSDALKELLSRLPNVKFDFIVFLGDVFGYYYCQEECIQLLKSIPNLKWLMGNHDSYAVEAFRGNRDERALINKYGHSYADLCKRFNDSDMDMISGLLPKFEIEIEGRRIGFFHGRPNDPLEGRVYPDTPLSFEEFELYDITFVGHTHCKFDRTIGHTRVISPGSLGQPRDGKGYGFLVYDTCSDLLEYHNIVVDSAVLENQIDMHDAGLEKLYDVLYREVNRT